MDTQLTLKEFNKEFFPNCGVVEITDKEEALSNFQSKSSPCWGNGHMKGTGWSVVAQPSIRSKGDKRTVFVCKTELIGANTKPYLDRSGK